MKKLTYRNELIKQLYFSGTLSCTELSMMMGKSLPLITKTLNELISDGFINEIGLAPSTGGRRSLMYSLSSDIFYIVTVAMDQFITRIAIVDINNNPVCGIHKFQLPLENNPDALHRIADIIEQEIQSSGIDRAKIAGIGIGMPGLVDSSEGINYSFISNQTNSISKYITEITQLPVFIDNDSRIIALAEKKFGAAKNCRNSMVINIGWGIGLGLILNSELFRGENGFSGEFSHIPIFENDKLCSCGKKGCLETASSLLVVLDKIRAGLQSGKQSLLQELSADNNNEKDMEAMIEAVLAGDQFLIGLISEAGYTIGRGVAILIHLLNPEKIILTGRGAALGKIWISPIQQALNENCIPRLAAGISINISELGYNAEIIGAACLVMENLNIPPKSKHKTLNNDNHLKKI